MKPTIRSIIAIVAGLFAAAFASAQSPALNVGQPIEFLVAAGSSSGTYKAFLDQIASVTNDTVTFKQVDSHGAVENLDKLINNEVMGAFMHSDVLYQRASSTDLNGFKTLLALYSEEVHILTLSQPKRTTGGTMGFGKTTIVVNTLDDLKQGTIVGAAGGGVVTANVIKLLTGQPYEVIDLGSGSAVLSALSKGEIDVAIFVGGAPLPNLKDLGPDYRLVPIGDMAAARLKQVYHPATVTYTKMSPQGVPTVAADCLFVARVYKSARFVNALRTFRQTFYARLDDLKETPGNHRKWQEVSSDTKGKWPYMDLGDDKANTVTIK